MDRAGQTGAGGDGARAGTAAALPPAREQPALPPAPAAGSAPPVGRRGGRRKGLLIVFLVVVVALAAGGVWYWLATRGLESTDDAFIAAETVQVAPKVSGRVQAVPVKDNQEVGAGDLLTQLDPSDYQARADRAKAALDLANAQLKSSQVQLGLWESSTSAAVDQAKAELEAARAMVETERAAAVAARATAQRAQADWERYAGLNERVVAASQRDVARADAETAAAQANAAARRVAAAEANALAAQTKVQAAEANRAQVQSAQADIQRREAEVAQARAELNEAELELSYTRVLSPGPGWVTHKSVAVGDYVQAGQALMALVPPDVYVIANFKETQLRGIHPGAAATIHVDAYDADFPAHVASIQAGAGAAFSLLPPENATGNYVKVVQRVPVKIEFDRVPDPQRYRLGPGMSVVPRVRVE